jgi:hypothetical protein
MKTNQIGALVATIKKAASKKKGQHGSIPAHIAQGFSIPMPFR